MLIQWGTTNGNFDNAIEIISFSNVNNYFVTASSVEYSRVYDMVIKVNANHIKVFDTFYGDSWGISGGKNGMVCYRLLTERIINTMGNITITICYTCFLYLNKFLSCFFLM